MACLSLFIPHIGSTKMAVAVDSLQVSVGKETVNVEVLPTKWDLRQVIAPKTEFKFGRKVSTIEYKIGACTAST